MASWETISRRTLLITQNKCLPVEYQRYGLGEGLRRRHLDRG
jgi:hypothetical protein